MTDSTDTPDPSPPHPDTTTWTGLAAALLAGAVWLPLAERYQLPPLRWAGPVLVQPRAAPPPGIRPHRGAPHRRHPAPRCGPGPGCGR